MASHAYLASESIADKQMMDFHVIEMCVFVQEGERLPNGKFLLYSGNLAVDIGEVSNAFGSLFWLPRVPI